jgi:hypothetical protein
MPALWRRKVRDEATPPIAHDGATFSFVDFIPSTKQIIDKDGFLLCRDVPVARTGVQVYGPGETPIETTDSGGIVRIHRDEDEVFHKDTIDSLRGAPVVNDHPVDGDGNRIDVTPGNWRQIAIGHVENPRRGEGDQSEFLLADLRIHDGDAIEMIRRGKRQVSCGYDADYDEVGPGLGRQKNIRCNHLALVDQARCGPVCAIGDALPTDCQETTMTAWTDRIRALAKQYRFKAHDRAALEAAIADAEEEEKDDDEENGNGEHHVHVHLPPAAEAEVKAKTKEDEDTEDDIDDPEREEIWSAIENIERTLVTADAVYKPRDSYKHRDARRARQGFDAKRSRDEDKDDEDDDDKKKTEDKRERDEAVSYGKNRVVNKELEIEAPPGAQVFDVRKARDSRYLEDSWAETISLAEILVPGIRLPTFDRATPKEKTYDTMCEFRRRVLDLAYVNPDGRDIIDEVTRRRFTAAKTLDCGQVREVFRATGLAKRRANGKSGSFTTTAQDASFASGGANNLVEYQKQLDAFYASARS